jgi:hypothetical protein
LEVKTAKERDVVAIFNDGQFSTYGRIDRISRGDESGYYRFDIMLMKWPPKPVALMLKPEHLNLATFYIEDRCYTILVPPKMIFTNVQEAIDTSPEAVTPNTKVTNIDQWRKK